VVVASPAFYALGPHLTRCLPEAQVVSAEPARLRELVARARVLIPSMARIDASLLEAAPELLLVHQWGAGLEGVDLEAATRLGIPVANVPTAATANADSVAEWCVMAILALARRLDEARANARAAGPWGMPAGVSLRDKVVGIVGFGGIGRALAARLRPFGVRLRAVRRRPDSAEAHAWGLEWVGSLQRLDQLLEESDFVVLAVPATPETRGIMGAARLARMKPGSYLINPARGALVDEQALLRALEQGPLAGAALDVLSQEPPPPDHPLLNHPKVLLTAHVAGVTHDSYAGIARRVADNIRRVQAGLLPEPCANPSVKLRRAVP